MPGLRKRNSNRSSPTSHIKHRLTRLERQQLHKIPGIRSSLQRPKMPSPFIPLKRVISPMPSSLQTHPFIIPIHRKQLRTNQIISHGPTSPHNKKAAPPKRRAATSIYQKKNRSNAKPSYQQSGAGAKQLQSGQNPTEVPLCGSPGEGKYIRSIASSARAGEHLMCSPCESGLSEQATLYICPPRGSSPEPLS